MLDFWATWCATCVQQLPDVQLLSDKFSGDNRLHVLSINLDADQNTSRRFVQDHKLLWMQGFLGESLQTQVLKQMGVSSVPTYLLIAPDGRLLQKAYSLNDVREKLDNVLKLDSAQTTK